MTTRDASSSKPVATLVVTGIGKCLTMAGNGGGPLTGAAQEAVGELRDAAVAAAGDKLIYVGPASGLPAAVRVSPVATRLDAEHGLVLPGFVDAHTHLVFAGWRAGEFAQRIGGASHQEILAQGGGILRTVAATRNASEEQLVESAGRRLRRMIAAGSTTIEVKSGYGLSLADEAKILRVVHRLDGTGPWDLVATFLGAHALPAEFQADRDGYVALIEQMIHTLADRASFIDAFCEVGAFTGRECRRLLLAGRKAGLRPKLHADQLSDSGGAALAAEVGAISADHLDCVSVAGMEALAAAGVVGVMLPGVPLYLMSRRQAPASRLQAAGVPLALATDFNPGTCPIESMGQIVAFACLLMRLSPAAALVAATRNAAHAVGRGATVGTLEVGKKADLLWYRVDDYRQIPYRFGQLPPAAVVKSGHLVARDGHYLDEAEG
ncbi:MAG: imidazolonepropionase [Acidobacteriota bacterium]